MKLLRPRASPCPASSARLSAGQSKINEATAQSPTIRREIHRLPRAAGILSGIWGKALRLVEALRLGRVGQRSQTFRAHPPSMRSTHDGREPATDRS
jgi:hypothetical protein